MIDYNFSYDGERIKVEMTGKANGFYDLWNVFFVQLSEKTDAAYIDVYPGANIYSEDYGNALYKYTHRNSTDISLRGVTYLEKVGSGDNIVTQRKDTQEFMKRYAETKQIRKTLALSEDKESN